MSAVTPRCAHACPICRLEVPVGVLFGACARCRRRADLRRRFLAALERVAGELDAEADREGVAP